MIFKKGNDGITAPWVPVKTTVEQIQFGKQIDYGVIPAYLPMRISDFGTAKVKNK